MISICIICQVCSLSCPSSDLRYWDLRQSTPVHTQQLPERCYSISVRHPLMVVGTADRNLIVFNLQNPQVLFVASRNDWNQLTFFIPICWILCKYVKSSQLFFCLLYQRLVIDWYGRNFSTFICFPHLVFGPRQRWLSFAPQNVSVMVSPVTWVTHHYLLLMAHVQLGFKRLMSRSTLRW